MFTIIVQYTLSESIKYKLTCRFKLYLKLFIIVFIVMGITWFMAILSWQFLSSIKWNVLYIIYSLDMMQNFGIFFIFVCKKTIKQQLLKRFGCQNCNALRKTKQTVDVTDSSTCSPTTRTISLWEKISLFKHAHRHTENLSDEKETGL